MKRQAQSAGSTLYFPSLKVVEVVLDVRRPIMILFADEFQWSPEIYTFRLNI